MFCGHFQAHPDATPPPQFPLGPSWNGDQGYPTHLAEWGGHCPSCGGAPGEFGSPCHRCQAHATAADDWMIPDDGIFAMANNVNSNPYMMPTSSAVIGQQSGGKVVLNAQAGGGVTSGKLNVGGGLVGGAYSGNGAGFNNARPAGIFGSGGGGQGGNGAQFVLESL